MTQTTFHVQVQVQILETWKQTGQNESQIH